MTFTTGYLVPYHDYLHARWIDLAWVHWSNTTGKLHWSLQCGSQLVTKVVLPSLFTNLVQFSRSEKKCDAIPRWTGDSGWGHAFLLWYKHWKSIMYSAAQMEKLSMKQVHFHFPAKWTLCEKIKTRQESCLSSWTFRGLHHIHSQCYCIAPIPCF